MTHVTMGLLALVGLSTLFVACSDSVVAVDACAKNPSAKGCRSPDAGASPATPYASAPIPSSPPPTVPVDAGKPDADGGLPLKPKVPPVAAACRDLSVCCGKVKDAIEKAACSAIASQQQASLCANAVVAYQVFGGCGHSPFSLPDIFNSDKTRNTSKDCTYLDRACVADARRCDAAYQCEGVSAGGTDTTTEDSCQALPDSDQYCCYVPNDPDCVIGPQDPCANSSDPFCCRNPNDSYCFIGPQDPCANESDPFCCRNPNDSSCVVGPPDPCESDPCSCGFCEP